MTRAWLAVHFALAAFDAPGTNPTPEPHGRAPAYTIARRKVIAKDGAAVALYRYSPAGGGASRPAVLIIPEVGFSRVALDLNGRGLAPYMASRERDVFVAELRGQGEALAPGAEWHLEDWVRQDLPAVADAVRAAHRGAFDLVVQGYSGALAMAATTDELAGAVRRVVGLSPAVAAEVPNGQAVALLEGGGHFQPPGLEAPAFSMLFARGGKFPSGALDTLRRTAFENLSAAASQELLRWMRTGDLALGDRATLQARWPRYDRPTLLILPLLDGFSHPEYASALRDLAPKAAVRARLLSRWELLGEDYTHLSVLQGQDAPSDVFSPALEFLAEEGP